MADRVNLNLVRRMVWENIGVTDKGTYTVWAINASSEAQYDYALMLDKNLALVKGDEIIISTVSTPCGLTAGSRYYVDDVFDTVFEVSSTNPLSGTSTPVQITAQATVTFTMDGDKYARLKSNQRYPKKYIDDAIAQADLQVMRTLLKSKQYNFTNDFFTSQTFNTSPVTLPTNTEIYSVNHYTSVGGADLPSDEVTWEQMQLMLLGGLLADTEYGGYYCVKDGFLYQIPVKDGGTAIAYSGNNGYYRYVSLIHGNIGDLTYGTLYSPKGFEDAIVNLASAILLMKRADQPEQSAYYQGLYDQQMQLYMTPSSNTQRKLG